MEGKRKCQYGQNCYRQNPSHLKEYDHSDTDKDSNISPKRMKLNTSPKKFKQAKLCFKPKTPSNSDKKTFNDRKNVAKPAVTKQIKTPAKCADPESSEDESDDVSNACDVTSNSWTFQKNSSNHDDSLSESSEKSEEQNVTEPKCETDAEKIKHLFLVEMPEDFYSFFKYCETLNDKDPCNAFKQYGLQLVGPYDVLSGKITTGSITQAQALCHWRFFLDPPEMQTILVDEEGTHYGYWRDDPKMKNCFIASNTVPSCSMKDVSPTVFGAVAIHMEGYLRRCSPFEKVKANNVLLALNKWAEKEKMDVSDCNDIMRARKKKIVAPTFHGLGIVVDVNRKTDVGYRPLLETNGNLKKICNSIINAKNASVASIKMEEVEKLVNAANIANDEGDFGNSLELGVDLFCMGSDLFHNYIKHLLVTAYTLLNRPEWAKVVKAHLKNRRTGRQLSAISNSSK